MEDFEDFNEQYTMYNDNNFTLENVPDVTDLGQAGVTAHLLVAAVLAVGVTVAHPAQGDAGT